MSQEYVAQLCTDLWTFGQTLMESVRYQGNATPLGLHLRIYAFWFTVDVPRWAYRGERSESAMKLLHLCKAQAVLILVVLMLAGCAAMTGRQSAGDAVDDTSITAKVKSSLIADPVVSASAIDVDTLAGNVSLNGIVTSEQERQRAIQLAQSTQGVRQVDAHNLVVKR